LRDIRSGRSDSGVWDMRSLAHALADEPLPILVVDPSRPDRLEPRALKRRPKE
jgi:hypothetical protein